MLFAIYSLGIRAQYQARFFREQPLVPIAGYSIELLQYSFSAAQIGAAQSGSFLLQGPYLGAYLLLNLFEPSAAGELFASTGTTRSYFVVEYRMPRGGDPLLTSTQSSIYLGLRLEH